MNNSEELTWQLASLLGFKRTYVDYKGQTAEISPQRMLHLIAATGIDCSSDEAVQRAITKLQRQYWLHPCDPIVVLRPHLNAEIKVRLPAGNGVVVSLCLTLESGEKVQLPEYLFQQSPLQQSHEMDGIVIEERTIPLPQNIAPGYHSLELTYPTGSVSVMLAVTPAVGYVNDCLQRNEKIWGTAIQLYSLRSEHNWGIGDFSDLIELIQELASLGAGFVGLNPIHALYPVNAEHVSPYSPSNRNFLNPLYVDVLKVFEFSENMELQDWYNSSEVQSELARLRAEKMIPYSRVSELKQHAFRLLFQTFRQHHVNRHTERFLSFRKFLDEGGLPLFQHCLFEALSEYFHQQNPAACGWASWPEMFLDIHSTEVQKFSESHAEEILFYQYLQFISDEQLQWADDAAKTASMGLGLYRDLAVGADRGGAEVWSNPEAFCQQISIGAPPDALGPLGQNWGLPPMDPVALRNEGYRPFITLVRNNMRACSALRIDHAMALFRLWWCPPGETAAEGAYIHYPFEDMLGILLLESQRNQCMIIAEDLGTVPVEVQQAFPGAGLYSNKVFIFEISGHGCTRPEEYARNALAIVVNHDMPTLAAYWNYEDLKLRERLQLFENDDVIRHEYATRAWARQQILNALHERGFLPPEYPRQADDIVSMNMDLNLAIHRYLSSGYSQLVALQLEDLMLMTEPVNVPGTSTEYPNWRRKLAVSVQQLFADEQIKKFCWQISDTRKQVSDQ
ncbi:4-alpha-glucanotransferase [Gynuella sunshinyii]|uniref:4-alpha-glucanotransferase n=1 Tax=Gynuella sunshinyii YC6258 TaxID=1445510 RepID=A0A0C5VJW9_9GAMM|nr:4-alpha-glucanotransferase [Gynuella sunshinyii]AJQ94967.1 4-alpha-glucanotransferase [Gynuella sunshinyii YC6258]